MRRIFKSLALKDWPKERTRISLVFFAFSLLHLFPSLAPVLLILAMAAWPDMGQDYCQQQFPNISAIRKFSTVRLVAKYADYVSAHEGQLTYACFSKWAHRLKACVLTAGTLGHAFEDAHAPSLTMPIVEGVRMGIVATGRQPCGCSQGICEHNGQASRFALLLHVIAYTTIPIARYSKSIR